MPAGEEGASTTWGGKRAPAVNNSERKRNSERRLARATFEPFQFVFVSSGCFAAGSSSNGILLLKLCGTCVLIHLDPVSPFSSVFVYARQVHGPQSLAVYVLQVNGPFILFVIPLPFRRSTAIILIVMLCLSVWYLCYISGVKNQLSIDRKVHVGSLTYVEILVVRRVISGRNKIYSHHK